MLASHLASIGKSRLIDFNHSLPMKEIVTQTLNPKWVDGDVAPCVSSASSESGNTDPPPKVPVMKVPKYYNSIHLETDPMVKSFSPGLDKLSGEKIVPYHLLNQQFITLFARLIDKLLHHLLHCPAGADPSTLQGTCTAISASTSMAKSELTRTSCPRSGTPSVYVSPPKPRTTSY
jgi:hypothetical protein